MAEPAPMTPEQETVVAWLRDHDEACPVCGYQLRGQAGAACSECGSAVRLGVIAKHAALRPYIFMIVACACALGFDSVSVLIMTYGVLVSSTSPPELYVVLGVMLLLALGSAIALWITLRSRQRIVRMAEGRWLAVAAIAFFIFIVHFVAGAFIISRFI